MRKFFRSGYAFLVVALVFLATAAGSRGATLYVSLAVVFLLLALAVRKKNSTIAGDDKPKS